MSNTPAKDASKDVRELLELDLRDTIGDVTEAIVGALQTDFPKRTGMARSSFKKVTVKDKDLNVEYDIEAVDYVQYGSNEQALESIVKKTVDKFTR